MTRTRCVTGSRVLGTLRDDAYSMRYEITNGFDCLYVTVFTGFEVQFGVPVTVNFTPPLTVVDVRTRAAIAGDAVIAVTALAASAIASAADTRPRLPLIKAPLRLSDTREITLSAAVPSRSHA